MKTTIKLFFFLALATMLGILSCAHYPTDDDDRPPDAGPCADASCPPDAPLPECRLNSDCSGCGDTCVSGACEKTRCCDDRDCPSGKTCNDHGSCVEKPECECDEDCGACGKQCRSGSCVSGCTSDEDCCDDEKCDRGTCKAPPPPAPCSCDEDCGHGWTCSSHGTCNRKT